MLKFPLPFQHFLKFQVFLFQDKSLLSEEMFFLTDLPDNLGHLQ